MQFLEKYDLSLAKTAKILGVLVLGIIAIYVLFSLLGGLLNTARVSTGDGYYYDSMEQGGIGGSINSILSPSTKTLSVRNVMEDADYSSGLNAEDFEVTEYSASIETRNLDNDCEMVLSQKTKNYVVFETSNKGDNNCSFRFKVKKDNVDEILSLIESLDPRDLNENIHSIKKQVEDFTSEEEILKRKLEVMEETLSSAIDSYDEISILATQTRNADSLASVIESKLKIIERLSQEKIDTSAQLERISRAKAEQLDKLEYTYFNVYIYENKFVDGDQLKDSWKSSVKSFVFKMNRVAQDLSIGLVALLVYIIQYLVYLLILVIVFKFAWIAFKRIWNK
ncbi:hypothetical protein C0584_00480 [Candidatus Parcubacteria bacterium]|nr:MAG: hypothetical protein C0584_00480 [Candidatus Parcubacteria bacterium]